MKEVDLYTLKKEKVLVTSDYISIAQYSDKPIHIRGSDDFVINAPIEVTNIPIECYQTHKDFGKSTESVSTQLVAFDPKIRELLGINEKKLKEELIQLKRLHDSALKTNESLVKYKSDLLQENEQLASKLLVYTTLSFWKRLVFLFTSKVN